MDAGRNFVGNDIHLAARRRSERKGVAPRTFENMLSSQAMCFNLFAPLASDHALAADVLGPLLNVRSIQRVVIEHTPASDIFHDQSTLGGVDCDVLIEATAADGARTLLTLETKFVEPDFSTCSFRDRKRIKTNRPYCADDVPVTQDESSA